MCPTFRRVRLLETVALEPPEEGMWDGVDTQRSSGARCLDLVASGRAVAEVATVLGVSSETIYTWHRQDRMDKGLAPGVSTTELAELSAAKRRMGLPPVQLTLAG